MKKIILSFLFLIGFITIDGQSKNLKVQFTDSFMQDSCTFSTIGRNTYFILEPGYQLELQGKEEKETVGLIITVLNETKKVGNVETRIVEEKETVNGVLVEISKNYFACCKQTSSIFYFEEYVEIYKEGKVVSYEGSWIAERNNKAGIIMPGTFLLGARYYQEIAPGIAIDRAEIISISDSLKTPCRVFSNCLKTEETTPLEPKNKEYKVYAPGIGLIKDGDLLLVKHGFIK